MSHSWESSIIYRAVVHGGPGDTLHGVTCPHLPLPLAPSCARARVQGVSAPKSRLPALEHLLMQSGSTLRQVMDFMTNV